jgi:hypothetical protein
MEPRVVLHTFEGRTLTEDEQLRMNEYALRRAEQVVAARKRKPLRAQRAIKMLREAVAAGRCQSRPRPADATEISRLRNA